MNIIKLSSQSIDSLLYFCDELKKNDHHPCSYWGYDKVYLKESIENKDIIILIGIENDEKVVGVGTLTKGGPFQTHWAEIGVAVHPHYRNLGLAQRIVKELELSSGQLQIEFIKALILENNKSSRLFFTKIGYIHKATLYNDFKIDGFGNLNDCVYYKFLVN